MKATRRIFCLARHIYLLRRTGQLRFHLETFGAYYPSVPYKSPWWRISPRYATLLLRRTWAYAGWIEEMQMLRRGGAREWWAKHHPPGESWPHDQ